MNGVNFARENYALSNGLNRTEKESRDAAIIAAEANLGFVHNKFTPWRVLFSLTELRELIQISEINVHLSTRH